MDKRPEMMLFHGHSDCDVPMWLLTEREKELLERNGHASPDFSFRYRSVSVYNFPGIFYRKTLTPFHEEMVPRYVQALFKHPLSWHQGKWFYDHQRIKEEIDALTTFQDDLNEFPVDELYPALFQLQDIPIKYDPKLETSAMTTKPRKINKTTSEGSKVVFGRKSVLHLEEKDYVHCVLLHELYHQLEFKNDNSIRTLQEAVRKHPRWTIKRTFQDQETFQVTWSDGKNMVAHELAELVAALAFVRYPEDCEKFRPYQQSLLEQRSGQLPLFPEPERTWYDSRP